ncbi:MAG: MFS transporter [Salinivirgaceae bacterium]|jgi:fucose permease|nr:MFS transporter [Salinivirgaceae bacterium]
MEINRNKLFIASCIALVATAMTFAIRADLLGNTFGGVFKLSNAEIGWCIGTAFWGYMLAIVIGGLLVDIIGMKSILAFAFVGHLIGIVLTIFSTGFWSLFVSTLFVGLANGFVEAACNPLVATLYPDNKTKMLNRFHVWFPGGIVIGGLLAYGLGLLHIGWKMEMAIILIPTLIYGFLFLKLELPKTERVTSGVSMKEMVKACFAPLFLFMVFCMFLTASTELGTNQWITVLLSNVGIPAILLLVFINGIMAAGRSFAGPIVHKLNPAGMLLFSAITAGVGLVLISYSAGWGTIGATAIFAIGITYFWPTMLGFVSEYLPRTGALGLSIMGGAGMLTVSFILPLMGNVYDSQTVAALPQTIDPNLFLQAVEGTKEFLILSQAKLAAGSQTLRYVAILPAFLTLAFLFLNYHIKKTTKV